jgi:hypothetical protein
MVPELDPRSLIDRQVEQEVFTELLPGPSQVNASSARVLVIGDRGGRGKSALLRRLLYNCRYEIKPPVNGCLISLDNLEDTSPFAFIKALHDGLKPVPDVDVRDRFAKFKQLNEARASKDDGAFRSQPAWSLGQGIVGTSLAGTMAPGARNAGVSIEAPNIRTQNIYQSGQAADWTAEQEYRAREKCIDAFFEDLRAVCATHAIVVLLDAWERCNIELREWIRDVFLGDRCLHPNPNLRPARLSIVIAGRHYDPKTPYGLRVDEFRPLFGSQQEYEAMVRDRRSLSDWDYEHVKQFMVNHGLDAPSDLEVAMIQEKLKQGRSLYYVLDLIQAIASPGDLAPAEIA